ncbi:hypothetical protein CDL15_Pgr019685 [Punica granatum]|uniref:Uncharacterized protein n=1 Tax=Punica granatum TaxID=22663 RepID=A0A218X593_PUNGR|nr:hypothetical protein CDL15_Pgr019685 [Punica granatum]
MSFSKNPLQLHRVKPLCAFSSFKPYESTKILSSHFKLGNVASAQHLFDEMPEKGLVSWSIMIHGYARNGHHAKSVELFSDMRGLGLVPNTFTMVGVLVSAAGLGNLSLARCVHGLVLKYGQEQDPIVGTALLNSYARCGSAFDSCRVFEGIKNPTLISSNAFITGLVHNGLLEDAVLLFNRFRRIGMLPGPVTMLSLIKACGGLGSQRLCEAAHGLIEKIGLSFNLPVENSVLDMYSSLLDVNSATKMFFMMRSRDTISWSIMMSLLVHLERASDALSLFHEMRNKKVASDALVIVNLISSCAILGDAIRGRQIHAHAIVKGHTAEVPVLNSLITMYSKCGDLGSSRTVFDRLEEKTSVSWAAIISGYEEQGCPNEALNLFTNARQEKNFTLDSVVLLAALGASSEVASLELCMQLHCLALRTALSMHRLVKNSLISAYSKSGNMELAFGVFNEMGSFLCDIVSWNAVLNGYAINSCSEKAISFYNEMREAGINPDGATYTIVFSACSRAGLVDEGLIIFNQMMEESRVELRQEHYGCLVDLLARAGNLADAVGLANKFLDKAGPSVWKALLRGCTLHQNVELGELAARRLSETQEKEPDFTVMLSNFYALLGRFEDAEVLRSTLGKKGLSKSPAISSITGIHCDCG